MIHNQEKDMIAAPQDRSIADRAYDLWGELQLEKETNELLEQIEAEQSTGGNPEMDAFFSRKDAEYLTLIAKHTSKQKRRHIFRYSLPRFARVAIIFIAIAAMTGSVALAVSPYLRIQVMRLFTTVTPQYTEVQLAEDESASFNVPADWKGTHYPVFLPEGMEIVQITNSGDFHMVTYRGITDKRVIVNYRESGESGVTHVDTEGAFVREVQVHGHAATLVRKGDSVTIYWTDGVYAYFLSGKEIDEDTALRIAHGTQLIK